MVLFHLLPLTSHLDQRNQSDSTKRPQLQMPLIRGIEINNSLATGNLPIGVFYYDLMKISHLHLIHWKEPHKQLVRDFLLFKGSVIVLWRPPEPVLVCWKIK